jgi:hypothetical protein
VIAHAALICLFDPRCSPFIPYNALSGAERSESLGERFGDGNEVQMRRV